MPAYIVKPDPTVDYYVRWSEVVDAPTHGGTRTELQALNTGDAEFASERFDRADVHGTSCRLLPIGNTGRTVRFWGWDDQEFYLGNGPGAGGMVTRANLTAYTRLVLAGRDTEAAALTVPPVICDRCGTPVPPGDVTMTDEFCGACLDNVPLCPDCTAFHRGEIKDGAV